MDFYHSFFKTNVNKDLLLTPVGQNTPGANAYIQSTRLIEVGENEKEKRND